jgi:hypothetical protein
MSGLVKHPWRVGIYRQPVFSSVDLGSSLPSTLDYAIGEWLPSVTMATVVLPRRFRLVREVDSTGISGTGVVAFGTEFPDGVCVTRWRLETGSGVSQTCVWDSLDDIRAIHGHNGSTRIEFID